MEHETFISELQKYIENYQFKNDKETQEWIYGEIDNYYQALDYKAYGVMVWGNTHLYDEVWEGYNLDEILTYSEDFAEFFSEYTSELLMEAICNLEYDMEEVDVFGTHRLLAYFVSEFFNNIY